MKMDDRAMIYEGHNIRRWLAGYRCNCMEFCCLSIYEEQSRAKSYNKIKQYPVETDDLKDHKWFVISHEGLQIIRNRVITKL